MSKAKAIFGMIGAGLLSVGASAATPRTDSNGEAALLERFSGDRGLRGLRLVAAAAWEEPAEWRANDRDSAAGAGDDPVGARPNRCAQVRLSEHGNAEWRSHSQLGLPDPCPEAAPSDRGDSPKVVDARLWIV